MPPLKKLAKRAVITLADTHVGRGFLLRNTAGFVPVFMLHRFTTGDGLVAGHDPALVRAALDYLRSHDFRVLTIDQVVDGLADGSLPERAVAFTIDDGYRDQGRVGAELFLANGCTCTIYLVTELVNGGFWPIESKVRYLFSRADAAFTVRLRGRDAPVAPGDARGQAETRRQLVYELKALPLDLAMARVAELAERMGMDLPDAPPEGFAPLSWDDVRQLERRGIAFGTHTARHVTLSAESDETAWRELEQSTRALQAHADHPSTVFCYPTGRFQDYGPREIGYLRELGFRAALSSEPGYCTLGEDADARFNILRLGFPDSLDEFKDIVLQLPRLRQRWRWRA
jgi:peptidoglycan/xylan/chitin deacetylase (PgdA/CDA1 family)